MPTPRITKIAMTMTITRITKRVIPMTIIEVFCIDKVFHYSTLSFEDISPAITHCR